MKRKMIAVLVVLFLTIPILTNAYAAETLFDMNMFETAYKLSNEAEIDLPFLNIFAKGATYDELVKHSGITIGESTIDVDDKLEGVHLITSTDMITIKGEIEHGFIYGNNIVIEGKISGDTVLIANNVKILEGAVVEKNLIIVSTDLEVKGNVLGHLIGSVGTSKIDGKISGDLRLEAVALDLTNGTVDGNIYVSVNGSYQDAVVGVKEKYPEAVIELNSKQLQEESKSERIVNIVLDGIKVVAIYSLAALIITRKENNIVKKAANRFKENTVFGILTGTAVFMLAIPLFILFLIIALLGLGVVAWPIMVIYIGLILLCVSISSFVVGTALYEILKSKVGKFKIPVLIAIFTLIFVLSQITAIRMYTLIIINLVAMAVILSYIFKREQFGKAEVEVKIIDDDSKKKTNK